MPIRKEIGVLNGLVGAAGGIGGYCLNFALGHLYDMTGSYASGFFAFAGIAALAFGALPLIAPGRTASWRGAGGMAQMPAKISAVPARAVVDTVFKTGVESIEHA